MNTIDEKGFAALLTVVIISAVASLVVLGVSLRAIDEIELGFGNQESNESLTLANLCAEQALMKLLSVLDYAGGETVTVGSETCTISSVSGTGNYNRVINAESTVSNRTRRVKVTVSQISPVMEIVSWEEVGNF
jgi:hypothetical protein